MRSHWWSYSRRKYNQWQMPSHIWYNEDSGVEQNVKVSYLWSPLCICNSSMTSLATNECSSQSRMSNSFTMEGLSPQYNAFLVILRYLLGQWEWESLLELIFCLTLRRPKKTSMKPKKISFLYFQILSMNKSWWVFVPSSSLSFWGPRNSLSESGVFWDPRHINKGMFIRVAQIKLSELRALENINSVSELLIFKTFSQQNI